MANVTDPLVAAVHGTDPQNLMEYITRQKIYDSRYWKEECFGLTAVNVLEKASRLKTIGGSYGGNMQPTKFLCLTLKMLQIQPDDELVDELIANEDFKYVRALGAFYKRLSGRPADIYESLEPLYRDFRKLRCRQVTEWSLIHMDEFVHSLLTEERVCGIALPRLPQRTILLEAGYLEGPRPTALAQVLDDGGPEAYLLKKIDQGSKAAELLYEQRTAQKEAKERKERGEKRPRSEHVEANRHDARQHHSPDDKPQSKGERRRREEYRDYEGYPKGPHPHRRRDRDRRRSAEDPYSRDSSTSHYRKERRRSRDDDGGHRRSDERGYSVEESRSRNRGSKEKKQYGNIFKKEKERDGQSTGDGGTGSNPPEEGSTEYWNDQRAKLGLKPLK